MAERVAKSPEALVVPPGAGRPLGRPDTAASGTLKASSEETGGAVTVFESTRPAGDTGGPQAHLHRDADEMFYVLEGEYRFQLGDRVVDAPRGTFVFIPRGTPHAFRNKGAETGRMLTVVMPGGFERFLEARAALPPGGLTPEVNAALSREHGMEVVGPSGPPLEGEQTGAQGSGVD
jgi:mannose-6-phosphate isomerase-like protein (cupin superfamily)